MTAGMGVEQSSFKVARLETLNSYSSKSWCAQCCLARHGPLIVALLSQEVLHWYWPISVCGVTYIMQHPTTTRAYQTQ